MVFTHSSIGRTFLRQSALVLVLWSVLSISTFSQEEGEQKTFATNLDVLRSLAGTIAAKALEQANVKDSPKVQVTVLPKESAWYIETGIIEGMKDANLLISEDGSAIIVLEFGLTDAHVRYSNIRRDGFFGPKIVDRKVNLRLTTRVVNRQTGILTLSSDIEESTTDTIELSEVSNAENPAIAITRGTLPGEGFFSNFAEPLIVIGSIAIAVILLFNVRS